MRWGIAAHAAVNYLLVLDGIANNIALAAVSRIRVAIAGVREYMELIVVGNAAAGAGGALQQGIEQQRCGAVPGKGNRHIADGGIGPHACKPDEGIGNIVNARHAVYGIFAQGGVAPGYIGRIVQGRTVQAAFGLRHGYLPVLVRARDHGTYSNSQKQGPYDMHGSNLQQIQQITRHYFAGHHCFTIILRELSPPEVKVSR